MYRQQAVLDVLILAFSGRVKKAVDMAVEYKIKSLDMYAVIEDTSDETDNHISDTIYGTYEASEQDWYRLVSVVSDGIIAHYCDTKE